MPAGKLDVCKPAAPTKFQDYCCQDFAPKDKGINCSSPDGGMRYKN